MSAVKSQSISSVDNKGYIHSTCGKTRSTQQHSFDLPPGKSANKHFIMQNFLKQIFDSQGKKCLVSKIDVTSQW